MKQGSNLNKVIECLQQQEKMIQVRPQVQDIEQIHNVTIDLLNTFGDHIDRCKKYNEARIHRKYQSTILLLEEQNISLKRKLELERQSVPSSQAYVSDLIDRMVALRNENDKLRKQNQLLQSQLSINQRKQEQQKKKENSTVEKNEINNQNLLLCDAISKFKKIKKKKGQSKEQDHTLLRFLQQNSSKFPNQTCFQMLERLDRWIFNLIDTRFIDSQRIRQNFQRAHSSIDQTPPIHTTGKTTHGEVSRILEESRLREPSATRLLKFKTQNMGNFVNGKFTIRRKKPRQAIHLSLLRNEGRTKSETNGGKR